MRARSAGPGTVAGTAGYMSPEQATGKEVDARSDVFSFGAVLYEMVTGRRAFAGGSTAETLAAVVRDQPKAPSEVVPSVPKELDRLIQRCLRKEPERRFQHMLDVKLELEQIKEDSESGRAAAAVPARSRRRLWLVAGLAGLLAMAAAAGCSGDPPPPPSGSCRSRACAATRASRPSLRTASRWRSYGTARSWTTSTSTSR